MKYSQYWSLVENGRVLHRSSDFGRLLNYTIHTVDAKIYFLEPEMNRLVWVQNP